MSYRCSIGDFVKTGYNHLKTTREIILILSQNIKGYLTQYCLHIVYHLINNTKDYLTQYCLHIVYHLINNTKDYLTLYCLHIVYPQTTILKALITNSKQHN